MKKSISVNIKGRIFNIEEDAYEVLKKYLDSIKTYFSSYEDADEIYGDIESRVAEILHEKITKNNEVITQEDVEQVMATIGQVQDFEAQEDHSEEEEKTHQSSKNQSASGQEKKRLYKDAKRQIVSGVCAGIAHYMAIDPFWIRLVFVFGLFLGLFPAFITYIILALILPKKEDLSEIPVKKLFRDGDEAVVGGVAAGIAKYFGTDPTWVRLAFVVGGFAGFGILTYFILWMITPEAKTRADKMQMEGEPVTISNIEKNIKDNLNLKDTDGKESTLATILLFPFRLVAQVFTIIGSMVKPLSTFIIQTFRFVGGFALTFSGLILMLALGMLLAIGIGLIGTEYLVLHDELPASMFFTLVPGYGLIGIFLTGFFPALLIFIAGLRLLLMRSIIRSMAIGIIFACWFISLCVAAMGGIHIMKNFREKAKVSSEVVLPVETDELTVDLFENRHDIGTAELTIKSSPDSTYRLMIVTEARGNTIAEAQENATKVRYDYQLKGQRLTLNRSVTLDDATIFTAQDASLTLYVPEGKKVRLSRELLSILRTRQFMSNPSLVYSDLRSYANLQDRVWLSNEEGFECLNCSDISTSDRVRTDRSKKRKSSESSYTLSDFSKISVSHAFDVRITQGNTYSVRAEGDIDELEKLEMRVEGEWLIIEYDRLTGDNIIDFFENIDDSREITIYIETPELDALDLSGATLATVEATKLEQLSIDLSGASELELKASDIGNCTLDISGASDADLSGACGVLTADVSGASKLAASELVSKVVAIEASGASSAKVHATETLDAEASGAATIRYKGNPDVSVDQNGFGNIKKDK